MPRFPFAGRATPAGSAPDPTANRVSIIATLSACWYARSSSFLSRGLKLGLCCSMRPLAGFYRAAPFSTFTAPFNATGQPAISLPLHWTEQGMPIGVQLVAAYAREDMLIRVAAQLEQARPWAHRRPPIHA